MSNQDLYIFDQCYERNTIMTELSFNTNILNSYNKYLASSVRDCEVQALRTDSEFFLINDISSIGTNNYTNCYIPKPDYEGSSSVTGSDSIIAKALELFDRTFIAPYNRHIPQPTDTCNNLLFNSGSSNTRCFKYLVDNKVYAPRNAYAYYKKPIISVENRNITLQDPQVYKDGIIGLKNYEYLLKIDTGVNFGRVGGHSENGSLANAFRNYICDPTTVNDRILDGEIIKLKQNYEVLFSNLDDIAKDISSINYLNHFDDETIIALNVKIQRRNKELTSLLSSGGANNGRLDDSTLLTQFKIVENSILLLIIITAIFFYNKMKK